MDYKTPLFHVNLKPRRMVNGTWERAEGLNSQRYADLIINGPLKEAHDHLAAEADGWEVVEDNAPCHNAAVANRARDEVGIRRRNHPSSSPDLNPIENLWAILKNRVNKVRPMPTTTKQLFLVASKVWDGIEADIINGCVESMPRRVAMVKANAGQALKY